MDEKLANGPDIPGEDLPEAETAADRQKKKREELRRQAKEEIDKAREALEVMKDGKGRLELETPIEAGDTQITELPYDFTAITGMEYTDAMDADRNANTQQRFGITYRQALSLFAVAAAKEVRELDMTDIVTRIGGTDAVEAVQLATLFFRASTQAGRKRISKK